MRIQFDVLGTPAPKGSGRAIPRGGKAIHIPSSSDANKEAIASWNSAVRTEARRAVGYARTPPFVLAPLAVAILFRMRRPADHYSKKGGLKPWAVHASPMFKPDADKLIRCTIDALTGIVFDDDARIVALQVFKVYANGDEGAAIIVGLCGETADGPFAHQEAGSCN